MPFKSNFNQRSMDCLQRQSVVADESVTADAGSIIRSIASFTGAGDRVPVHPAAVTDTAALYRNPVL